MENKEEIVGMIGCTHMFRTIGAVIVAIILNFLEQSIVAKDRTVH